jgi:hypothetical protein
LPQRLPGYCPVEAQLGQVQAGNECIDDTGEGLWRDIVVDARWQ